MDRSEDTKWAIANEISHLRRFARALIGDPDKADDVVQDCLERALHKRRQWQRKGSLRSWLFHILYTTHLNHSARRKRDRRIMPDQFDLPEIAVAPVQEMAAVATDIAVGVDALPEEQRAAVLLVALEGMDYAEAADALGVPIGTVRSRLWRGRQSLRHHVAEPSETVPHLRRVK